MKVYLASSWKNKDLVNLTDKVLTAEGLDCYNFTKNAGFWWGDIDKNYENWTKAEYQKALDHPLAKKGFNRDKKNLDKCDVLVLIMECGKSAHLEAGYMIGQGKPVFILSTIYHEMRAELMYKLTNGICRDIGSLAEKLKDWSAK